MVASSLISLDMKAEHPDAFYAKMHSRSRSGIHLAEVEASGHEARRGPHKAMADRGSLILCLFLAGEGTIIQNERQATLGPGDFAVYDTGRPVQIIYPHEFNTLYLKLPQSQVSLPARAIPELVAQRIAGRSALGPTVAAMLTELNRVVDRLPVDAQMGSMESAAALAATMIRLELTGSATIDAFSQKQIRFERITTYINEHLHDPDLDIQQIAAENFISIRYLHSTFSDSGWTVAAWIRNRRLTHCANDLVSPALSTVPVSVIAYRNGFRNQAYFSQIFKEWAGQTPASYRAGGLGMTDPRKRPSILP